MDKQRKLYSVRHAPKGHVFGKPVGYKQRLLARNVALRVVKRLKRSGVDAYETPLLVTA